MKQKIGTQMNTDSYRFTQIKNEKVCVYLSESVI